MAANIYEGRVDPAEDNFCHRVLSGQVPNALDDAATHPVAGPILAAAGAKVGGFINVAVRLQDGSLYGTICCFDAEPARGLGPRDLDLMNAVAELLGRRIERDLQNGRERRLFRNAVARTIEDRRISFVLQPIVDLRSRLRFAEEVLSRFNLIPHDSPRRRSGTPTSWASGSLSRRRSWTFSSARRDRRAATGRRPHLST